MDPDGQHQRNISNSPSTDDVGPAWSPDGTMLAFRRGKGDIWVMDAEGNSSQELTTTGKDAQPTWSPDGNLIAFRSSRSGDEDIWVMDAEGNNAYDLTSMPNSDEERPVWWP
jgi:TolB protein